MTGEGGRNGWDEETMVGPGPDTVRMPTSRPVAVPEEPFRPVEDLPAVLIDGVLWAPAETAVRSA